VSFAYPFGSYNDRAEGVVANCGYTSGLTVSGVTDRKVFGETIPPLDPYATRTPPNPKQGTTVATIEGYVTAADLGALAAWLAGRPATTVVLTTAQAMASA
jgi:hypothetical protein